MGLAGVQALAKRALIMGASFALVLPVAHQAATIDRADATTNRACRPVVNPYPNTRYEGINLSRIRSEGIRCQPARRVARRAHAKALGMSPNRNGILRFRWNGWMVVGDLRPPSDRYVARKYGRQVRWRF